MPLLPAPKAASVGAIAQQVEHLLCKEGVRSSSLLGSTARDQALSSAGALREHRGRLTMSNPGAGSPRCGPSRRSSPPNPSFRHTHDLFVRAPERVVHLNK